MNRAYDPGQTQRQAGSTVAVYMLALILITSLAGLAQHYYQRWRNADQQLDQLQGSGIDVGFAQSMSQHHEQAILMAQMMLDGRPSRLTTIARTIAGDQLIELGLMRGWLELWKESPRPANGSMDWMLLGPALPDEKLSAYLLACRQSPQGMAGLASVDELNSLRDLQGEERDQRFLELMLAHHEGGLPMAQFAWRFAKVPAVKHLAGRIVNAQAQEVASMRALLARMQPMAN